MASQLTILRFEDMNIWQSIARKFIWVLPIICSAPVPMFVGVGVNYCGIPSTWAVAKMFCNPPGSTILETVVTWIRVKILISWVSSSTSGSSRRQGMPRLCIGDAALVGSQGAHRGRHVLRGEIPGFFSCLKTGLQQTGWSFENHGRWPRLEVAATCVRVTVTPDTTRVMTIGPKMGCYTAIPMGIGWISSCLERSKSQVETIHQFSAGLSQVSSRFCCSLAASYLTNSASTCHVDSEVFNNLATKKATR